MPELIDVYCDESCHLENDRQQAMVLGAVWCPHSETKNIARRLRDIKKKHGFHPRFEMKWTKVSPKRLAFYQDVLDYFFDDDNLSFRAIIIPDKSKLNHSEHNQGDHDTFYYKMYFQMLSWLLGPDCAYRIFIDIKDTRGGERVAKLHRILCSANYDYDARIIQLVQLVKSNEVEQQQLADLLVGCVSYANRNLSGSSAKMTLVERAKARSRYKLTQTTLMREKKFNLLRWRAKEAG